jgi:hypothetical protein
MIPAPALGDVVKEDGHIERSARSELLEQGCGQRVIVLQLAAFDRREQPDRSDRVLVHRIMVVHVELHLCDDTAEVGHEAAEHPRLVHPPQHEFG